MESELASVEELLNLAAQFKVEDAPRIQDLPEFPQHTAFNDRDKIWSQNKSLRGDNKKFREENAKMRILIRQQAAKIIKLKKLLQGQEPMSGVSRTLAKIYRW